MSTSVQAVPSGRALRVLVADDSSVDAELEVRELRRHGFDVTWRRVETAEEFDAALAGEHWDAVISDYSMPTFTGLDALRRVRAFDPELPFILVSGVIDQDTAVEAIRAGANDYLLKDRLRRLGAAVERELDASTVRRQQKVVTEALTESMQRFRSYFETPLVGACITSPTMEWLEVNDRLCQMLGYSRSELHRYTWADLTHPDDVASDLAEFDRVVAGDIGHYALEKRFIRKDGTIIWTDLSVGVVRRTDGTVNYFVALMNDITARKEIEAERERMREQLFQAQKMESVGRLAGGVAHDFNNMLGVIIGHAQLAMLQSDLNDEVRSDLEEILKAAERSANHTRQLLAFARRQTIRPRIVELNSTLSGMLSMLRRLIGEDVELRWRPGHDLWRIRMDPSQIDQIVANLVTNARDAIGGVGEIVIETNNVVLDARPGREAHDFVLLSVSDNGRGMDEDTVKHVFEPFFTTKDVGQGTGLGLAMVHGVVEQNKGFIGVTSSPGVGTTFKIYLPRADGPAEEGAKEEKAEVPRGTGQTILLVEDETPLLALATSALGRLGYEVVSASSAEDALEVGRTRTKPIDLLVTDVVMPRMNGSDLAAALRRLRPDLPCLFISGYTAEVIAARGVLEDGVHFLQKPFTLEELGRKVHGLVRH